MKTDRMRLLCTVVLLSVLISINSVMYNRPVHGVHVVRDVCVMALTIVEGQNCVST
jgi:hypothetical protein